jgi:hypothetical protein
LGTGIAPVDEVLQTPTLASWLTQLVTEQLNGLSTVPLFFTPTCQRTKNPIILWISGFSLSLYIFIYT